MENEDQSAKNFEIEAPSEWYEFVSLARDYEQLEFMLRVRLISIAFGAGSSSDCRAIEALLGMPSAATDDEVDDDGHNGLITLARQYLLSQGFTVEGPAEAGAAQS